MKPFRPTCYLRRFWVLILCVTLAGELLVFRYANDHQQSTAVAVIRYTTSSAADGLAPDGTPLDAAQIYSPEIVSKAVTSLGMEVEVGQVRAHCTAEPILTEEQQRIAQARNSQGQPSACYPDTFRVQLTMDAVLTAAQTRELLDAILQEYSVYFTARHTEQPELPCPTTGLLASGLSSGQCIGILMQDSCSMLDFLQTAQGNWSSFRSSQNGCTYADLYDRCQQTAATLETLCAEEVDVETQIQACEAELAACYQQADCCWQETLLFLSAQNLQRVSSVQVQQTVRVELYLALALMLFLAIGCGTAILAGRLQEIAQAL